MAIVRKEGFDLEAFKKGIIGITAWGDRVKYAGVGAKEYLVRVIADTGGSWNVTNTGKVYMDPPDSMLDIVAMLVEDTPKILSFTVTGLIYEEDAGRHETEVHGRDEDGVRVVLKVKAKKYADFRMGSKVTISVED